MKTAPRLAALAALTLAGCNLKLPNAEESQSLPEARKGFQTKLTRKESDKEPPEAPPKAVFRYVLYTAPNGKNPAYVSPDPKDGKKHPAIVWITGGDCNSIGDVWSPQPAKNDQSASPLRQAGVVMMFPALRGGNGSPGVKEGFFGEVDDVLAAADYIARQDYVDPKRIYLGGHSTGGTLAFLVAASTDRFRAVFSFGPTDDVTHYPDDFIPFDRSNPREAELRSPVRWTHSVKCPTFVFEGTQRGNIDSLNAIQAASKNPLVQCFPVQGADHFSLLQPTCRLIAQKISADDGPTTNITFTEAELGGK